MLPPLLRAARQVDQRRALPELSSPWTGAFHRVHCMPQWCSARGALVIGDRGSDSRSH